MMCIYLSLYLLLIQPGYCYTDYITTIAGTGSTIYSGDGSVATNAALYCPTFITFDNVGNLYIADTSNNRIRKLTISTGIISTIAGNGTASYSGDNGEGTNAALNSPYGVAVDVSGKIYTHYT